MDIYVFNDPLPYVLVRSLYSDEQFSKMVDEWNTLYESSQLPDLTGGARNEHGELIKRNKGVFLDNVYLNNREDSPTLINNRILFDATFTHHLERVNPIWGLLRSSTKDKTLVSYYHNDDNYGKHFDSSALTALTWFLPSGKQFSGGVLRFCDYGVEIEPQSNLTVLFIGSVWHEVTPLVGDDGVLRVTMSQFVNHTGN